MFKKDLTIPKMADIPKLESPQNPLRLHKRNLIILLDVPWFQEFLLIWDWKKRIQRSFSLVPAEKK